MGEREITLEIKKPEVIVLLLVLFFFFILEARVILNSPIAFGDEGFHTILGKYVGENKDYPKWVPIFGTETEKGGFQRPPLLQLLEGSFTMVLGYRESLIKILIPFIASILTGLVVFVLGKKIFDNKVAFIGSIIAVSVPSFVTYSVLFYTDVLLTFYFTLFILTFILALTFGGKKYWILAGTFSALSLLTKTPGFIGPVIVGFIFLYKTLKNGGDIFKLFKEFLPFFVLFALISSGYFIRNVAFYKTPQCSLPYFDNSGCDLKSGYKHQFEYEGRVRQVGTEVGVLKMGLINYLDFAYGNVWFVPLVFLAGLLLMFFRKNKIDLLVLAILLIFSIIVSYQSKLGRSEDVARWFLGIVPLVALVSANYLKELYEFIKKYQRHIALVVLIVILFFSYQNLQMKLSIMKQVKQFSPAFFEACNWIRENIPENARLGAVIWGGATAYNCQREVGGGGADVALSQDLTLALSVLKYQNVTHIFIQKFSISWQDEKLTEMYPISFVQFMENNSAHFKKIYENGHPLDQCRQTGGCDGAIVYEINYSGVDLIPVSELIKNE